jgi:dTDP-4-dehydrorhamnose reductase
MKAAIVGANGQLGVDLMKAFAGDEVVGLMHAEITIEDLDSVQSVIGSLKPDVVVNTAAFHKVDDCEKDPARSFAVNALGALNLAKACQSVGAALAHVSTDYVYAVTKLAGEHFVQTYADRHYVVRTCGLYGHSPCRAKGRNFIDTMLKLAKEKPELRVVNDEILTPTYTYHLAQQIRELVTKPAYGVYHVTNNGSCSWYEFAMEIFRLAGVSIPVVPVSQKEFPAPIKRPSYSVLENRRLQELGIDRMPQWKASLEHYFATKPPVG